MVRLISREASPNIYLELEELPQPSSATLRAPQQCHRSIWAEEVGLKQDYGGNNPFIVDLLPDLQLTH